MRNLPFRKRIRFGGFHGLLKFAQAPVQVAAAGFECGREGRPNRHKTLRSGWTESN